MGCLWVFVFWLLIWNVQTRNLEIPFVQNYYKQTYLSVNQSSTISKDIRKGIYLETTKVYWFLTETIGKPFYAKSTNCTLGFNGKVYVGAFTNLHEQVEKMFLGAVIDSDLSIGHSKAEKHRCEMIQNLKFMDGMEALKDLKVIHRLYCCKLPQKKYSLKREKLLILN